LHNLALSRYLKHRILLRALGCLLMLGIAAICVIAFIRWIPEALVPTKSQPRGRVDEISKARTAFLTMVGGLIAVAGAVYTAKTYRLSRQGQITDRLTRAIDQLGNEHVDIRLGSIYALERLARESPADQSQIIEILTGYVRQHAPWVPAANVEVESETTPAAIRSPADIHAALRAIGRRNRKNDHETTVIDLASTDLRGVPFDRGDFIGASFIKAHLDCADLSNAKLANSDFSYARLDHADLTSARLDGANFANARLKHAALRFAHLSGVKLRDTDLSGANLFGATLDQADLWKAKFVGASLWNARLAGVIDLTDADFSGALGNDDTTWPVDHKPLLK
jgi:uncharacterized protein YjbI with pentapeptide repeats